MGGERLRVIADDLTGACDVGVEWLPWEGGVGVQVRPGAARGGASLVVQNTASRTLPPASAAAAVATALADLPRPFGGTVVKKVDTGLRGQLGVELDAAIEALGRATCVVAPAIPEVGRVTRGGRQYIRGVPIDRTALAGDPQNPVVEASVAAAIAAGCRRPVALVSLAEVRGPGLPTLLAERGQAGTVAVCDAESDADLARVVAAALAAPRPLLLVGSTGLARQLRSRLGPPAERPVGALPLPAPVLVVSGSAHPAARRQLRVAAEGGLELVRVPGRDGGQEEGRIAGARLGAGKAVALCSSASRLQSGVTPQRQLAALARAARVATEAEVPGTLLLIGGETAGAVLRALGSPPLRLVARPAPLVALGRIASGPYRDLAVVTKGGSSGGDSLLAGLVEERGEGKAPAGPA